MFTCYNVYEYTYMFAMFSYWKNNVWRLRSVRLKQKHEPKPKQQKQQLPPNVQRKNEKLLVIISRKHPSITETSLDTSITQRD